MKFWSNFVIKSKNEFYEVKPFHENILIKLCYKSTERLMVFQIKDHKKGWKNYDYNYKYAR